MNENYKPISCDINSRSCCSSFTEVKLEKDFKSHWDKAYERTETDKLGWYEIMPEPSLLLIDKCKLSKNAALLNVGAGASTLVDELLKLGYENIIANDLSSSALNKLKARLGEEKSDNVRWIVDDLTRPTVLKSLEPIALWHDRAVLHFFNEKKEQEDYFDLLKKLVQTDGFVILATFNLNGATNCSGLPVHRYNKEMLQEKLGASFELLEAFDYTYTMPSGSLREYVYTLFKRMK